MRALERGSKPSLAAEMAICIAAAQAATVGNIGMGKKGVDHIQYRRKCLPQRLWKSARREQKSAVPVISWRKSAVPKPYFTSALVFCCLYPVGIQAFLCHSDLRENPLGLAWLDTICPETITELIRFRLPRCKNYVTAPEINSPRGPNSPEITVRISLKSPVRITAPKIISKTISVM